MIFPWGNTGWSGRTCTPSYTHLARAEIWLHRQPPSKQSHPRATPVNSTWAEFPGLPGTGVWDRSLSLTLDHHIRLGDSRKPAVEGIYFTGS